MSSSPKVTTPILSFDSGHEELIHDAQLDYYGKRLATASSDRTIKIFDVSQGEHQHFLTDLTGHDGPVWKVAWSHPKFGTLLASCSYDRKVFIWREDNGTWTKIYEAQHNASVNCIDWAPHYFGLIFAAASSDGTISVHKAQDNKWESTFFDAHMGGVNTLSFAPAIPTAGLVDKSLNSYLRFVSGGCDNHIRIWRFFEAENKWNEEKIFENNQNSHNNWVRDVKWAPSLGVPTSVIASCSEDRTIIIWVEQPNGMWKKSKTLEFPTKVWRVSWSSMGNILTVAQSDKVTLWKEGSDGEWKNLSSFNDNAP